MISLPGQQLTTTHILPNISRSKDNQALKFGQLIEYNMRNIFLEKSYAKCDREASPRPFYKKSKLISGAAVGNVIKFILFARSSQSVPIYIKTKVLITCFYLI